MLDFIIFLLLKYTYVLAAVLFLVKIFLFLKNKNKNWTMSQFLFFNPTNIQFTPNAERAKLKRVQNQLSIAIIVLLAIQIGAAVLF
ncbi:MAG: hypothetical protein JWR87_2099 [Segetibacter sp.]|jgi:hypothetical protein|nr:hypothetical protein [Segetibacter sp.]